MVVQRAAGKLGELAAGRVDAQLAGRVGEAHDRIGVGDEKLASHERHAERRVQPREEYRACLRDAVAVSVAQQRDAVGALLPGAGDLHEDLHEEALDGLALLGTLGRVRFGHQHVAVRQHVQPARMLEAAREGLHREPRRCDGLHALRPADRGRHVGRGNELALRRGNHGIGAHVGAGRQAGGAGAARQHGDR
jgi:hypothetical protein